MLKKKGKCKPNLNKHYKVQTRKIKKIKALKKRT